MIDIPNQINAKKIYIRGQSYPRQMFIREHCPFEWRPLPELRRRYEEPLEIFPRAEKVAKKQVVVLEFMREEEATKFTDYPFKREQDRVRRIVIGNCRLKNTPMEKNGAYELAPKVSFNQHDTLQKEDKYFECDLPKNAVNSGAETVITFKFKPPQVDPLLQDIKALKGIGQWIESIWECKISGGFIEAGQQDLTSIDVVLRAYVE